MAEEFDKEIDALLRQAARGGENISGGSHLDADEINAFAEDVLPAQARLRAVRHLADCSRCRKVLSNTVDFNTARLSEITPAVETQTIIVPWYKRVFAFPQAAYAMGLTALVFAGIVFFIASQNLMQNNSSEIAQIDEKSQIANSVFNGANTNSASLNSAAYANSNSALTILPNSQTKNNSPAVSVNSNVTATDKNSEPAKPALKTAAPPDKPELAESENSAGALPAAKNDNYTADGTATDSVSERQAELRNPASQAQSSTAPPPAASIQSLPINGRNTQAMRAMRNKAEVKDENSIAKEANKTSETKNIGGKNFRRTGGIWYDAQYKGQKIINIARGSSDYQKLDDNLRSIADQLGGVVIIVTENKAYRIQ